MVPCGVMKISQIQLGIKTDFVTDGTANKSSSLGSKLINVYNCFKSDLFLNRIIVRILLCFKDKGK